MIVCIKRPGSIKLVEVDEVGYDGGMVSYMDSEWDQAYHVRPKTSDTVVLIFDAGELIMRVDENGAKMYKGNVVITQGAD